MYKVEPSGRGSAPALLKSGLAQKVSHRLWPWSLHNEADEESKDAVQASPGTSLPTEMIGGRPGFFSRSSTPGPESSKSRENDEAKTKNETKKQAVMASVYQNVDPEASTSGELELFGETAVVKTEPIYFLSDGDEDTSWSQFIWRQFSSRVMSKDTPQRHPRPPPPAKDPPGTDQADSLPAPAAGPHHQGPSPSEVQQKHDEKANAPLTGLGWVFQRVDTEDSVAGEGGSPGLQRMRKEHMLLLQQDQQCVTPDHTNVARRLLQMHLAVAQHCFNTPHDDLLPLWTLAGNPRAQAPRLRAVLQAVLTSNPQIARLGGMYCDWWYAAATNFRDIYEHLVQDMQQRPMPPEETADFVFVRPASALGHIRQVSSDSVSIASVMGIPGLGAGPNHSSKGGAVCGGADSEAGVVWDALAMLSTSPPTSLRSRSYTSLTSDMLQSINSDIFVDALSWMGEDEAAVVEGDTFLLLDRHQAPVAKVTAVSSARPIASARAQTRFCVATDTINVGHGLDLPQDGPYIRRDIEVEFQCDVGFEEGEHVPAVLQGTLFKGATVSGIATTVQKHGAGDAGSRGQCVTIRELCVVVDGGTRLGNYVCISLGSILPHPCAHDGDCE